jgi:hypothetical protein
MSAWLKAGTALPGLVVALRREWRVYCANPDDLSPRVLLGFSRKAKAARTPCFRFRHFRPSIHAESDSGPYVY